QYGLRVMRYFMIIRVCPLLCSPPSVKANYPALITFTPASESLSFLSPLFIIIIFLLFLLLATFLNKLVLNIPSPLEHQRLPPHHPLPKQTITPHTLLIFHICSLCHIHRITHHTIT